MKKAYIGVGSNLGNRTKNIERAYFALSQAPGVRMRRCSSLYRTSPLGGPPQRSYVNAVWELDTAHSPRQFLSVLKKIEKGLGPRRRIRWGPRTIDLDILAMGLKKVHRRDIKIPHPRYARRRFVLEPFCEIKPGFVHPRLRQTNRTLLSQLTSSGQRVTILSPWKKPQFPSFKRKRKTKSPLLR